MKNWQEILNQQPGIFVVNNWVECTEEKRKDWRLPSQFYYFSGGETALRAVIVFSEVIPKEEDFLLAGLMWANRSSNGVRTVIYFIAPDFSPFFLHCLDKVGGVFVARAVYWREKLSPSLYLIPDQTGTPSIKYSLGEPRPDWIKWRQELNPVTQQQLMVVKEFFEKLSERRIRTEIKPINISFMWGNLEIAEIRRKGKKFELCTKVKWEKNPERSRAFQRQGWVDASGTLNSEFCTTVLSIINYLEEKDKNGALRPKDLLALWLHHSGGIVSTLWGVPVEWPWLPKERGESWVHDLGQWFYFEGNDQLSVVCPIFEKPLSAASHATLLACVLEKSHLLSSSKVKNLHANWDLKIHWLTLSSMEDDLRQWLSWIKTPEYFQIWTLPENWQKQGLHEIACKSISSSSLTSFRV